MPTPVALPPVTTRRGPLGALAASFTVLVLVAAFGGLLFLRNQTSTTANTTAQDAQAQTILTNAAQVKLRDTQMNVSMTDTTSFSSGGKNEVLTLTETGQMAITSQPFRLHLILTGNTTGTPYGAAPLTIEEIVTSTAIYIKTPPLPGEPATTKPWHKANVSAAASGSSLASDGFLNFTQLSHPTLIGEETINGRKTWHLRVNLSDVLSGNPSQAATATAIAQQGAIKNLVYVEDLWIIEANSFPAQIKVHESAGGAVSTSGIGSTTSGTTSFGITLDVTYLFTSWNTGLTIALPPPSQVTTDPSGAAQAHAAAMLAMPAWLPDELWARRLADLAMR
jgi:hypothetical protein